MSNTGILELLIRLQDICNSNGIEMWLMDRAALSAFRGDKLACNEANVCVYSENILRLEKALQEEKDFSFDVESMLNNKTYPRYELRVFDPRTTDCNTADFYRINNNCMHVTVHPLLDPDVLKNYRNTPAAKLERLLFGLAGRFRKIVTAGARGSKVKAGKYTFDKVIFRDSREVMLNGNKFMIPADHEEFFNTQFGYGWKYLELNDDTSDANHFYDAEKSWKEVSSRVSEEEIKAYVRTLNEFKAEKSEYSKANKELNRIYEISDQCVEKIRLYRSLVPRIDELRELQKEKNYQDLEHVLKPYLTKLKKYCDAGLDMYINDDLTDITLKFLRETGEAMFAGEIEKLIPENREPVYLTDCHGKPLEQLPEYSIDPEEDGKHGLSETQKRLLDLMKKVDAFLTEYDIEYYLFGGSLLGAIRHNGFIPWDDDIDIIMDRANYYKLIEVSDKLPWDNIAFDCYEKNPEFKRPFGMFTLLSDTRFVKSRIFNGGAGLGTGIDVFIMDNVPRESLDEYLRNGLLYQEVMTDVFINNESILEYKDEYFECKANEAKNGKDAEIRRLRAELEKYGARSEEQLQIVRLWARRPRIYEPGMMNKPVRHKFEDTEFPVPERAVECLAMQYGDDWNVVPEGSGRQTHAFRVDYEISANNYYRLIDKSIDWDNAYDALNIRKQNRIRLYDKLKGLDEFRQKLSSGSIK